MKRFDEGRDHLEVITRRLHHEQDRCGKYEEELAGGRAGDVHGRVRDFAQRQAGLLIDQLAGDLEAGENGEQAKTQSEAQSELSHGGRGVFDDRPRRLEGETEVFEGDPADRRIVERFTQPPIFGQERCGKFLTREKAVAVDVQLVENNPRMIGQRWRDDECERENQHHAKIGGNNRLSEEGAHNHQAGEPHDDKCEGVKLRQRRPQQHAQCLIVKGRKRDAIEQRFHVHKREGILLKMAAA